MAPIHSDCDADADAGGDADADADPLRARDAAVAFAAREALGRPKTPTMKSPACVKWCADAISE
eukprot:119518-Pleurochrysis_carterae.AAC.2